MSFLRLYQFSHEYRIRRLFTDTLFQLPRFINESLNRSGSETSPEEHRHVSEAITYAYSITPFIFQLRDIIINTFYATQLDRHFAWHELHECPKNFLVDITFHRKRLAGPKETTENALAQLKRRYEEDEEAEEDEEDENAPRTKMIKIPLKKKSAAQLD